MCGANRLAPLRPAAPFAQRQIDPFRQRREPVNRRPNLSLHDARRETSGKRIYGFDWPQAIKLLRPQYEIGMRHLRYAAVELDPTADDALGADRQQPSELIALCVEVD